MLEMIETVRVIPSKESQDGSYNLGNCFKYLRGQSGYMAVVYELAPNDMLEVDMDFSKVIEETGTYQVLMDQ
jgi:hypothetical protein